MKRECLPVVWLLTSLARWFLVLAVGPRKVIILRLFRRLLSGLAPRTGGLADFQSPRSRYSARWSSTGTDCKSGPEGLSVLRSLERPAVKEQISGPATRAEWLDPL